MSGFKGFTPSNCRVAVIGAGAAGICTARILAEAGYRVKMYEASRRMGGTWVYSSKSSKTSALYESLRCNIPKDVMSFSDHPFPSHVRCFPSHHDVHEYLQRYWDKYQIHQYCMFDQRVVSVRKTQNERHSFWELCTSKGLKDNFEAVVVCNGHFSKPHHIEIPGSEPFLATGGTIMHSNVYKVPEPFTNRRVLVIGSGPSGVDISYEICKVSSQVFLSHRKAKGAVFSVSNGTVPREVVPVKFLSSHGEVHLEDGTILRNIDSVVLCTGYEYYFPFLESGTAGVSISAEGSAVCGLVRQCVAAQDPTLAFIGLPWSIIPFPLFEDQAHFLVSLYDAKTDRRKVDGIFEEENEERRAAAEQGRNYHRLGDRQWEYRRQLACVAGRPLVTASMIEMERDASAARLRDPTRYREREYVLLGNGPGEWRVLEDGADISGRDDPASPVTVG